MKTLVLAALLVLSSWTSALADTKWDMIYGPTGFYPDGTYLFLLIQDTNAVVVYQHNVNWNYLGYYGQVPIVVGVPTLAFPPGIWQAVAVPSTVPAPKWGVSWYDSASSAAAALSALPIESQGSAKVVVSGMRYGVFRLQQ